MIQSIELYIDLCVIFHLPVTAEIKLCIHVDHLALAVPMEFATIITQHYVVSVNLHIYTDK